MELSEKERPKLICFFFIGLSQLNNASDQTSSLLKICNDQSFSEVIDSEERKLIQVLTSKQNIEDGLKIKCSFGKYCISKFEIQNEKLIF
jgi:hypothetical protein